jgi:CRP-like cAMP-binding protein
MLYREGDAAESVLVLLSGWIKISRVSRSGEEVILRIKGPGEIVGSLGLAPGEVYSSAAHTLEECHLLSWDVLIFETLCERFPRLRRNVMHMQAQRLQVLEECFCDLATEQVGPRLARMILRLLEQNGGPARKTPIDLSCEELAQMTGTTLFTVSRLLCKWAELGIIQPERKMVLVEDLRGLTEIAEGVRQPA